jgi:hypothetical protein
MSNDCFCSYSGDVTVNVEHIPVIEGLVELLNLDQPCLIFEKASTDGTMCFWYDFSDEANWARFENIQPMLLFLSIVQPLATKPWVETMYYESDFGSFTKEIIRGVTG